MEYQCISADCHIDLNWLPYDLFVSNATKAMTDRMPYVVQGPDGPKWVTKSGVDLGFANGKGGTGALSSGRKFFAGKEHRVDRIASTGLFEDGCQGIFRPTTPELRLKDQDRDGIQAEVLYGLLGTGRKMTDREATVEFLRIYNDWLSDFCNHDRKRFVGLASVSNHSVDEAVAETRRVAKLGLGGVEIRVTWDMIPLWNPYWNPLWQAATEVNLPVHVHTFGPRPAEPVPQGLPEDCKMASQATHEVAAPLFMANILGSVIHGGVLERYPKLRFVMGESDIGWIPYVLDRMDNKYEDRFKGKISLKMKPSDYWRRQCRATFQDDIAGAKLLDMLGVETVMWASDYPHPQSVFPDSQEYIKKQFGHLPGATQRKLICENAGKFYGLM